MPLLASFFATDPAVVPAGDNVRVHRPSHLPQKEAQMIRISFKATIK
jgi:hypothetical protein